MSEKESNTGKALLTTARPIQLTIPGCAFACGSCGQDHVLTAASHGEAYQTLAHGQQILVTCHCGQELAVRRSLIQTLGKVKGGGHG